MKSSQAFREADVILIRKNDISCFFAKSIRATKVMRNWQMYNRDGHPIYVAQISDENTIPFLTWLSLQGLLIKSKSNSELETANIPTLSELHFA